MGILWVLPKIKFMPHIHPQQFNEVKQIYVYALASLRSIISITYNLYGIVNMSSMSKKFPIHEYSLIIGTLRYASIN